MSEEPEILFSIDGRAGLVTLNRPKALNALTLEMFRALHGQLREWEGDDRVERIIIEGAGDRAFCAGGDIRRLYEWGLAMDPRFLDLFREEYLLNTYIKHYSKPYIALHRRHLHGRRCRGVGPRFAPHCERTGNLRHAGNRYRAVS
jgi:enoyl-CoA hydratase